MFLGKSITFDESEGASAGMADMSVTVQNSSFGFVQRLKDGDAVAFDQLVTKYAGDVFALAFRLTHDREESDDITQETFLSAVKGITSFRGDAELKTWLFRIAINHSRNRFRWWKRRKRDKTVSLDDTIGDGDMTEMDRISDTREDPEKFTLSRERETAITRELQRLPEAYREALILCDVEGYSYDEVATILNISIGTVKSRIARGRSSLRERLKDF